MISLNLDSDDMICIQLQRFTTLGNGSLHSWRPVRRLIYTKNSPQLPQSTGRHRDPALRDSPPLPYVERWTHLAE